MHVPRCAGPTRGIHMRRQREAYVPSAIVRVQRSGFVPENFGVPTRPRSRESPPSDGVMREAELSVSYDAR